MSARRGSVTRPFSPVGAERRLWTAALRSWTGESPNPFKTKLIVAAAHHFRIRGTPGPRLSALSVMLDPLAD